MWRPLPVRGGGPKDKPDPPGMSEPGPDQEGRADRRHRLRGRRGHRQLVATRPRSQRTAATGCDHHPGADGEPGQEMLTPAASVPRQQAPGESAGSALSRLLPRTQDVPFRFSGP